MIPPVSGKPATRGDLTQDVIDTGRYIDPSGGITDDPYGGGQPDGIRLLIRPDGWRGFFYGICPACGARFKRSMWCWFAYSGHYCAVHLGIRLYRRLV